MKNKNKSVRIGRGNNCPKCGCKMERRKHLNQYFVQTNYYFEWWDYCRQCKHLQHYEEAKMYKDASWMDHKRNFFE